MAENSDHPENAADSNPPKIKIKSAEKKSDTTRIDLASAKPPPSITDKKDLPADADDYFKRSTIRIDAPAAPGVKDETAKLDISAPAQSTDDVFKSKTIPVGIATPPPQPSAGRPKTIIMKRPQASPGESIIVSPETTESATAQARKSETARIDLAAEDVDRPATRPKTIRIKRPDGTSARKALTITRPEESDELVTGTSGDAIESDEPGALVGIVAIAALLVSCVLVYVLLAQTFAPDLPFPGRI